MTEALDQFLARLMRCFVRGEPLPPWRDDLGVTPKAAAERILFHGIALQLVEGDPQLSGWPTALADTISEQARLQTFWEMSHRDLLGQLIEKLHSAGAQPLLIKGSALAYSLYEKPALRRRSDSDLLVKGLPKRRARGVLASLGFTRQGDVVPMQEAWEQPTSYGFTHEVDVHWGWKSSPVVSACLDTILPAAQPCELPAISPHARGAGHLDNLVLVSINRASHEAFGYINDTASIYENNRLIWAIDLDTISRALSPQDWERLPALAEHAGCARLVADAFRFAEAALETHIPRGVLDKLVEAGATGPERISAYYAGLSTKERVKRDFAASKGLLAKFETLSCHLFPGAAVLHRRYPDATHWPLTALRLRRLASSAGRVLTGKALA
ncbi:MAG: nucleotidyltransferase family protein [Pseudomonadota bacterium]